MQHVNYLFILVERIVHVVTPNTHTHIHAGRQQSYAFLSLLRSFIRAAPVSFSDTGTEWLYPERNSEDTIGLSYLDYLSRLSEVSLNVYRLPCELVAACYGRDNKRHVFIGMLKEN